MVTTSEGSPTTVMTRPLKSPAAAPTPMAAMTPSRTMSVASQTQTKPTMPRPMTEGNDRSMSPDTMTIVSIIAMMPNCGTVWPKDL